VLVASTKPSSAAGHRLASRSWLRGLVHLGLLLTVVGALGTLTILYIRNAIHADVGFVFVGLVVAHLLQRRHTVARMMSQLTRVRSLTERGLRLAASDLLLALITLNVLVSGVLDWNRGEPLALPVVPRPFNRWHLLSGFVLVCYLTAHVWRRRTRLRRSTIQ